jgi:DNA-directed RNA polymerase specialized sigma24 family protein
MTPNSVTHWLDRLRDGDRDAVGQLWRRYFGQLVRLARARLGDTPRGAADEEDVALSAFDSFCRRAEQGQFPHLADRHDLWGLLVLITSRKVCDLIEHEGRDKRDFRRLTPPSCSEESPVVRLLSREPDPAFLAEMADSCHGLLARLGDEQLRAIALKKLEGYSNPEIAVQLDLALATIERRLTLIRELWAAGESS